MTVQIVTGHAPDVLARLPEKSVQVCVTSPPYWRLRRYYTPPQVWANPDGTPPCGDGHEYGDPAEARLLTGGTGAASQKQVTNKGSQFGNADAGATSQAGRDTVRQQGAFCRHCGAWRGELGSEPTPEMFVAHLVHVFAGVWRVLRDDGTLWVNLGDSYYNNPGGQNGGLKNGLDYGAGRISAKAMEASRQAGRQNRTLAHPTIKHKDLCLIPWRFAIAMQEAGWYVRSTVVWAKKSPMPESVTDRPSGAWEPILLFTKQPRYFWDAAAVREPGKEWTGNAGTFQREESVRGVALVPGNTPTHRPDREDRVPGGANMRNVWHLSTEPLNGEHYASYPTEIPRRAILAGSSEKGACVQCGAPWRRILERRPNPKGIANGQHREPARPQGYEAREHDYEAEALIGRPRRTIGWEPTCACGRQETRPCLILDPFGGSGTTGVAATEAGRDALLIDLNDSYADLTERRLRQRIPPLLLTMERQRQRVDQDTQQAGVA